MTPITTDVLDVERLDRRPQCHPDAPDPRARGEVAVAGRRGKQRLWDLAERVHPVDVAVVPADEAHRVVEERRLQSLGIARPRIVGAPGEPVEVEDTPGEWRVDPTVTANEFEGRTALLSRFDRLIHNRPWLSTLNWPRWPIGWDSTKCSLANLPVEPASYPLTGRAVRYA